MTKPAAKSWRNALEPPFVGAVVFVAVIVYFGGENSTAIFILLGLWAASGFIGKAIAEGRGRGTAGFWLGLLLGPIGWIVAALLPADPDIVARANARALAQSGQPPQYMAPPPDPAPTAPERTCPWCAETIKSAAIVCRFCGRDVEPVVN